MNEAYDQLAINPLPFGNSPDVPSPEADASCPGLTGEQLAAIDFDRPSMQTALQEWVGLLLQAGELPTETNEQMLTGGATVTPRTDCPMEQKPVLSCTVDPVTFEEICNHARDASGTLLYETVPTDCGGEISGPGQIWNAADRVTATERITGPDGYIGTAADRVQEAKDQIRNLPGALDCTITPRPPACDFGFDPIQ